MATYMYTFDYIKISGTDPYVFISAGAFSEGVPATTLFVEPSRAIPHFSTTGTFEIDLDTGECGIVQTYDNDSKETIYYILSDDNFESSNFFSTVSFSNYDSEKTLLKNRFGFPILDTEDEEMGVLYTMADFDTIITDSVNTFTEQGSSSELPVLLKSYSAPLLKLDITDNVPKSKSELATATVFDASANRFLSEKQSLDSDNKIINNSVGSSIGRTTSGTSGMGGY